MARRPKPEEPRSANLTPTQMRQAIARIGMRVRDLENFDAAEVNERWSPETLALQTSIEETLSRVFGEGTIEFNRYSSASNLDNGPLIMGGGPDSPWEIRKWLDEGKKRSLALLRQAVKGLEEHLEMVGDDGTPGPATREPTDLVEPDNLKPFIFIVHGHDGPAKMEVARLIERAGLNAVILHELPNAGRTIIEKFEDHGGAARFAVVVVTPDDLGGPDPGNLRHRARQNVIGEMFWFAGRLGRDRVCALIKGDIEMPSDVAGVGYTDMDDRGAWKSELLKELVAAGYTVDWGKALA